MRAKEAIGQRLVLAQQSQQQVLRLNVWRSELACLIPCEENDATCFFRIAFEHVPPGKAPACSRSLPCWPGTENNPRLRPVSPLSQDETQNLRSKFQAWIRLLRLGALVCIRPISAGIGFRLPGSFTPRNHTACGETSSMRPFSMRRILVHRLANAILCVTITDVNPWVA